MSSQTLNQIRLPLVAQIPNRSCSSTSSSFLSLKKNSFAGNFLRVQNRCHLSADSFSDFPLLPFESDEVLVPSESKTLHLYEARFLALLEESLLLKEKLFVHFVLDPVLTVGSSSQASFAARYGCLVLIENVEQLEIGALVTIRGIGRVNIVKYIQMEPYLRGLVIPMQDKVPECVSDINSAIMELQEDLFSLHTLQIKLKASKDELLQTHLISSLRWAEREHLKCDKSFIPTLPERISFSALQPVSGSTHSELLALQREKLRAMELEDTSERLANSIELVKKNTAMVAAKLAIQSLEGTKS